MAPGPARPTIVPGAPAAPPAEPRPPGPAAAAALVRAEGLDGLLAALAEDLGLGRDVVLVRALGAYRKLARRARRREITPEALLSDLLRAHERRAVRAEIESLRATVEALRKEIGEGRARARAIDKGTSAAELFRQIRAARVSRAEARRAGHLAEAEPPEKTGERSAKILTIPGFSPDAQRALSSVAAAANQARPEPAFEPIAARAGPAAEARLDYAERRASVPKITF